LPKPKDFKYTYKSPEEFIQWHNDNHSSPLENIWFYAGYAPPKEIGLNIFDAKFEDTYYRYYVFTPDRAEQWAGFPATVNIGHWGLGSILSDVTGDKRKVLPSVYYDNVIRLELKWFLTIGQKTKVDWVAYEWKMAIERQDPKSLAKHKKEYPELWKRPEFLIDVWFDLEGRNSSIQEFYDLLDLPSWYGKVFNITRRQLTQLIYIGEFDWAKKIIAAQKNKKLLKDSWVAYAAISRDRMDILHLLEEMGFGINHSYKDADGNTPLHLAAKQGNLLMIEELLEAGANPRKKNSNRKKPIDLLGKYHLHTQEDERIYNVLEKASKSFGLF